MAKSEPVSKHAVWKSTVAITDWHYLRFIMYGHQSDASNDQLNDAIDELSVRMHLAKALESGFGIIGSSSHIDLLQWDELAHNGILRISHRYELSYKSSGQFAGNKLQQ